MSQLIFILLIPASVFVKEPAASSPVVSDTALSALTHSRSVRSPGPERELTVRLSMPEELPVGHSFGGLVELLRPVLPADHVRNATARRVIASKLTLLPSTYFVLVGGNLTLAARVDREALVSTPSCKKLNSSAKAATGTRTECVLVQRVVMPLADSSLLLHAALLFEVIDVDDNFPHFPVEQLEVTLSEGAPVGTVVLSLPAVTDADELQHSDHLEYCLSGAHAHYLALSTSSQPFTNKIQSQRRVRVNTTGAIVSLVLARSLDRETQPELEAEVEALESRRGMSLNSSVRVRILVGDVNEYDPVFVRMPANSTVTLSEAVPIGTLVWHLHAFDNDTDDVGDLRFGLSSAASEGVKKHFRVEARSGELRTTGALDFETTTRFEIPLLVWDRPEERESAQPNPGAAHKQLQRHSRTASATLVVQVANENDNSPAIALRSHSLEVRENTHSREDFFELVTVTDADPGDNERLACAVDDPRFAVTLPAAYQGAHSIYSYFTIFCTVIFWMLRIIGTLVSYLKKQHMFTFLNNWSKKLYLRKYMYGSVCY